jgi:hypothetical protein
MMTGIGEASATWNTTSAGTDKPLAGGHKVDEDLKTGAEEQD